MSHFTPDDLRFLIFNRVAMRYQHDFQHQRFLQDGHIEGDAYSLADPHMWHPPDEEKTQEFERAFRNTIGNMCGMGVSQEPKGSNGWLVLLKDQYEARNPERNRDSYPGPIFPMAPANRMRFHSRDLMASLQMTDELLGGNVDDGFDSTPAEITDRIADRVIDLIGELRRQAADQSAGMEQDAATLDEVRGLWQDMQNMRRAHGMRPEGPYRY